MVLAAKPKPPSSAHHRKRTGSHHKHTKPYAKAYWPYLPMLAVIGFGFLLHFAWPQPGGGVLAYATSMSAPALLQETNAERAAAGQSGLTLNDRLMSAAQAKAEDMASRNYWSHATPDGVQPWWFVTNAGYAYLATGENLAYGFDTSRAAVTGWMNSPGHRANILNAGYREVGFGIANASNYQTNGPETIVVAFYGTPAGSVATVPATPASASVPATDTTAPAEPAPSATSDTVIPTTPATQPTPAQPSLQLSPTQPATTASAPVEAPTGGSTRVARLELAAAEIPQYSVVITTLLVAVAATVLVMRHLIFWHRALVKGEEFLIRHWKLDLAITGIIVIGSLVTRTAGFIQ